MTLAQTINGRLRSVPAWPIYIAGLTYAVWLVWQGASGALGVDGVKMLEYRVGKAGLQLLLLGLLITPLRKFTGISLIRFRRTVGLLAFGYIVLHLSIWLTLDLQLRWGEIWADIRKRPYITIGMLAFLAMIPLAVTSNNLSVRRLGAAAWQRLHLLTYPAAALGTLHYVMLNKTWAKQPVFYVSVLIVLLALRLWWARGRVLPPSTRTPSTGAVRGYMPPID